MEYLELPDGTSYLHLLKNRHTLWEVNNEPQLYEVEIVHENDNYLDKDFEDIINMNKVYCNICNLDVPKIYQKQHNESSIHKNLIKITEEVFERTKKHLRRNDGISNASLKVTDTFYCDICSKIILNGKSNEHFESKFHKNQVVFEKLLNFFVEAYLRINEDVQLDLEDLPESISKDASQLDPAASKDPSNITNEDPAIKIYDPDNLDPVIEKPWKTMEKRNLPTSTSSKMDPTTSSAPITKDTKSEQFDKQSNLNTTNSNLNQTNPKNSNFSPMNPNFNNVHQNYHHINSFNANWNPVNPNLQAMIPNLNPMIANWNLNPHFNNNKPNVNPMNPNFNPMNPNSVAINPMNPNSVAINPMNPNSVAINPMNPNSVAINPMNPNSVAINPMNPNSVAINPMNPNSVAINPMNLHFNPMNPNSVPNNPMNPNFSPMNPNLQPIHPNFNPNFMNPNFNPIHPHFNQMNPHLNPMDSRYKINPSLNNPMNPQHKLGPSLHIMDPQYKLDSNTNLIESQPKLSQNLILMDPHFKSDPTLIQMDPQSKLSPSIDPQFEFGHNSNKIESESDSNSTDTALKLDPNVYAATVETKKLIKATNKAERQREKKKKDLQAFEEFSTYIKTIQDKYPNTGFKIEALTVSKIKVTALNGDCVLVSRGNFQSYNKKYCRVCQNGDLGDEHEMSEEHVSKIMIPVADRNCIREIDDIWSHCIICNELIKFVEDHNKTAAHLANLRKCFIDIPKQKEETDPKNTEELFNNNIVIEYEEEKHIQYTKKDVAESEVSDGVENRNIVDIENTVNAKEKKDPLKFDIDKFSNSLADKLLPFFAKYAMTKVDATEAESNESNSDGTLKTLESLVAKVQDKVEQLKDEFQNMVDINDESAEIDIFDDEVASNSSNASKNKTKYCSVCRLHITDFEIHKTSDSHTEINNRAKELRKIITRNNLKEIKDSVDLLKCDICGVHVYYEAKTIDEHVNSERHRRNYFKFIESNKIILIDQVESQCEPCNKSLHRSNIFDHCNQLKHVKKLKDLINKANTTQKESKLKQSNENKAVEKDIDVTKILYHFRAQGEEYLCKICHALVSTDALSVKEHVESKHHLGVYNTLLRKNKIVKTKGSFYCGVCNAKLPMTGEITHVYGRNHSDNLILKARAKDETNGATVSTVVESVATPIASTSKEVPTTEKEFKIPLYVKYQFKIAESASTCIICAQTVPNSKIIHHTHTTTHIFNFNLIMINNTIKIQGKMYFCVSCNTSVPIFGEVEHIFGKLHVNKKGKQQPIASNGTAMLTYDHVLSLTQGKRMVKF